MSNPLQMAEVHEPIQCRIAGECLAWVGYATDDDQLAQPPETRLRLLWHGCVGIPDGRLAPGLAGRLARLGAGVAWRPALARAWATGGGQGFAQGLQIALNQHSLPRVPVSGLSGQAQGRQGGSALAPGRQYGLALAAPWTAPAHRHRQPSEFPPHGGPPCGRRLAGSGRQCPRTSIPSARSRSIASSPVPQHGRPCRFGLLALGFGAFTLYLCRLGLTLCQAGRFSRGPWPCRRLSVRQVNSAMIAARCASKFSISTPSVSGL